MSTDLLTQGQPTAAPRIVVAIDGPAGAGKSTIARQLAERFGLLNLETGAMYRAFALKAMRKDVPLDDVAALNALAAETAIGLEPGEESNRVFLDGEEVTGFLRNPLVTDAASKVSVISSIRAWLVRLQQQLGERGGVVMEGRDIGTVVFPQAEVKIFLDADPAIRGKRRYDQMGAPTAPELEAVIRDVCQRDERDRNRTDSPLRAAEDAVVLDSTLLTLDQVIAAAGRIVEERIQALEL
jgi:cytidylate kinase